MKNLRMGLWMLTIAVAALVAGRTIRAEEAKNAAGQNWYVIESKHTGPECLKALDDMNANSLLNKTYWSCKSGDHRGWTILQAPSSEAALKMIPESQRAEAKIAEVGKFTTAQLQSFHASKKG